MKKHIIFVAGAIVLALGGGFWYYRIAHQEESSTAWAYVPENAIVVYETSALPERWKRLTESPLWNILKDIPAVQHLDQQTAYLDSLPSMRTLLNQPLLTALQVVGNDALDATFFLKLPGEKNQEFERAIGRLVEKRHLRYEERQYHGYTVRELSDPAQDQIFSYILHKGVFAGSFTPFLVEDVVRNIAEGLAIGNFTTRNPTLLNLPKLANDEGNLYVNARRLSSLLSVFAESEKGEQPEAALPNVLDVLCQAMLLDVSIQDRQLLLNGLSEAPVAPDDEDQPAPELYLQTLAQQPAQAIGMGNYIPNRTAWLYYLSFGEAVRWQQALFAYQQKQPLPVYRNLVKRRQAFEAQYRTTLADWYQWVGQEAALLTLESVDITEPDRALLVEVLDTVAASQNLARLAEQLSVPSASELYQEQFSSYTIGELAYTDFPSLWLGPIAGGYDRCFYLITDEYLVMANSVRTLKRLMLDKEAENTWSKSLKQSRFLENALDESNLSLVVDVARSWELLLPRLSPTWREVASNQAVHFKQLEKIAIQFSGNEETFYTSLTISYPDKPVEPLASTSFKTLNRVFTDHPIRTKPYVVRNHNTQGLEVLIQDEHNVLQLISPDQKILWKDSLNVPITSQVYQVDFYQNGKLQYLFASDSAIHLLDRNGNNVEGYPLYMPSGVVIQHFSLIDYDNSKNYRFLVSDPQGGLWMFNKDRENLAGWNPNGIASTPASPPFHVRVRDKDCLIAIGQDGTIYTKNRRGEDYPGFPLRLDRPCHSAAFVTPASTLGETTLTTVTDGGELITINLLGNITQRVQLYRPSAEARFSLVEDVLGKTYILLRQGQQSLGVLDRQGVLLFEKDFFSPNALVSGELAAQYYDLGAGNEIFAITDQIQEFTYLFDRQGKLINDRPVESEFAIGLLYLEDQQAFRLYRNFDNEFAVLAF